jgi:hypothetical protein
MPVMDLAGQSYELSDRSQSPQRTINYYIEKYGDEDPNTKSKQALVMTPGATLVEDVSLMNGGNTSPCRGLYYSSTGPAPYYESRLYGVYGNSVYRWDSACQNAYHIGDIASNSDAISMTDNGLGGYFVIVDGFNMYRYPLNSDDGTGVFEAVDLPYQAGSTTDKILPTHVCFLGQRLILNHRYGNQFYYSKLASTEFDFDTNADWYSAEQSADIINSLKVANGNLYVFGPRSVEIWRTTDNFDAPYSYLGGSAQAIGCKSPTSVAVINDMVFWLGGSDVGNDTVYMARSQSIERVSQMGIEDQILSLTNRDKAIGWTYSSDGNIFYILSFVVSNRTFVYEATTKTWCERLARDLQTSDWKVYPYVYGTFANDKIYVGTLDGSALCYLNRDKYTEWNGNQIVRQRITPVYWEEMNNIILKEILVDGYVGATPYLTGQGSDPKILLDISRDGGNTYGNSKEKSIGKQGNYRKVVRWQSQGMGRALVFKFTYSEPVPFNIYQMRLDYVPCKRT